ncbi:hypothetical protein [Azospirillum sp. sgz302134]
MSLRKVATVAALLALCGCASTAATEPGQIAVAAGLSNVVPPSWAATNAEKPAKGVTLPAGTLLPVVLQHAVETSDADRTNPLPVAAKVVAGPLDLLDCNVILAGFGNVEQRRVYMQAQSITCAKSDGEVVDANLSGFATGVDGKSGMRGNPSSPRSVELPAGARVDLIVTRTTTLPGWTGGERQAALTGGDWRATIANAKRRLEVLTGSDRTLPKADF